jgi:hypothetical protein
VIGLGTDGIDGTVVFIIGIVVVVLESLSGSVHLESPSHQQVRRVE